MLLGRTVSEATVRKYRARHRNPPSQTWRTFLDYHLTDFADADFMLGGSWPAFFLATHEPGAQASPVHHPRLRACMGFIAAARRAG